MAKRKLRKAPKASKQEAQKNRAKGQRLDNTKPDNIELSEELAKKDPDKTPPNKLRQ